MRRKLLISLTALMVLLLCCGCASPFEEEYYHEEDFSGDLGVRSGTATEISNYNMLKTALTNLIILHEEHGEFSFVDYSGRPSEDLAAACFEIRTTNPLGAYAVDTLTYDTNRVVSYYVADIYLTYKRTAKEIQDIQYCNAQSDVDERLFAAVDSYRPEIVIRIFSPAVDENYILKTLHRHYFDDPVTTVFEPKIEVESFPSEGENRVYDIHIDYSAPAIRLLPMSLALDGKLHDAVAALTQTEQPQLALEAAAYLSSHCGEPSDKTLYASTAYGAYMNQQADSKGFALAYSALCQRLGIECTVVEGSIGTMGAEPHFWNMICLDGDYYHVDVSAFAKNPAGTFLLSDDRIWGTYIWDTDEYPVCSGRLTYSDVAGSGEETGDPSAPPAVVDETPTPEFPAETEIPAEENEPPVPLAPPAPSIFAEKME